MKSLNLKLWLAGMSLFILCAFIAVPTTKLEGTWKYNAPDAPYGYQTGILTFKKKDQKWVGILNLNGNKQKVSNLKVEKQKVSFVIWEQGTKVTVHLLFADSKKFDGTVSYAEQTIKITGQKSSAEK